jgi:hypothetical protein
MNYTTRSRGWVATTPDKVFAQQQCIIFVDMIGSTKVWEMIWKLERIILKNKNALSDASIKSECWEFIRAIQNTVVECFVSNRTLSCNFVKGIGDGFIFQSNDILAAYDCAKNAENKVLEKIAELQLPILKQLTAKISALQNIDLVEVPQLCTDLLKALNKFSYRFVIHWTDEVIHGSFYMRNRTSGWTEKRAGLLAVEQTAKRFKNIKIKIPFYPDIFGHDVNYAARCIGVIKEHGIYLTQKALDKLEDIRLETGAPPRDFPLDWKTQISAKGISGHVAFYKVTYNPNRDATIDHYMTKALVKREATADPETIFENLVKLLGKGGVAGQDELLRPHLFSAWIVNTSQSSKAFASSKNSKAAARSTVNGQEDYSAYRVLFRVEGPDQEYLESVITSISELLSARKDGTNTTWPTPIDTETKFIRTVASANENKSAIERWAKRDEHKDDTPYFYAEFSVDFFDDIDSIAENVIRNAKQYETLDMLRDETEAKNCEFKLVELLRLWGKPAIFAILKNVSQIYSSDIGDQVGRVRDRLQEWSADGKPLKSNPDILVQHCTHFASVRRPTTRI